MTYVYLDPEAMRDVINRLRNFANEQENQRTEVVSKNQSVGGPVRLNEGGYMESLTTAHDDLHNQADDLQTRLDEAVEMSKSGITPTILYQVSYYLPEGYDDTIENVRSFNSGSTAGGAQAARDLKAAINAGDSERIDQILAEMTKHQDVSAYAVSFIQTMGADGFLDAPLEVQPRGDYSTSIDYSISDRTRTMLDIFTHLMEAASTTEAGITGNYGANDGHIYNLPEELYNAVAETGHQGRATVLDAILNNENVPERYTPAFLVNLANRMENITTPSSDSGLNDDHITADDGSPMLPHYTADPLAAVLGAMRNNWYAALMYFAPEDPDSPDNGYSPNDDVYVPTGPTLTRATVLSNHHWSETGMERLTAFFAAMSSVRQPPAPENDLDERASWATGQGIIILAEQFSIPQSAKPNIGMMLGNCGPEVTGVANNSNIITPNEESYKIAPITTRVADEEVIRNATAELMYRVSDSSEANYAIARGTTAYAAARASEHAAAGKGGEASVYAIKNVYDAEANVIHLLTMLDQDQANYAYNGSLAALSILSLVPGVNGIMATVANAGLTAVGPPTVDATGHSSNDILLGAAYTNAFNSGNIEITPPTDLKENPWYSTDENGAVRITLETDEQVRSFYSWVQAGGARNPLLTSQFTEIGGDEETRPFSNIENFKKTYKSDEW